MIVHVVPLNPYLTLYASRSRRTGRLRYFVTRRRGW